MGGGVLFGRGGRAWGVEMRVWSRRARPTCGSDAQGRRAGVPREGHTGKVACTMSCEKGCETKPCEKRTKKTMLPNMRERCAA